MRHWTFYSKWFTGLMHLWTAAAVEICLLSGLFTLWCLLSWWDLCGFLACWTWLSWVLRICSHKYWGFLFSSSVTHGHLSCFFKSWFLRLLEADCVFFHVAQQMVLRRKLLAPTSKDFGSRVRPRLDDLSNKKPGSSSYTTECLSHRQNFINLIRRENFLIRDFYQEIDVWWLTTYHVQYAICLELVLFDFFKVIKVYGK